MYRGAAECVEANVQCKRTQQVDGPVKVLGGAVVARVRWRLEDTLWGQAHNDRSYQGELLGKSQLEMCIVGDLWVNEVNRKPAR